MCCAPRCTPRMPLAMRALELQRHDTVGCHAGLVYQELGHAIALRTTLKRAGRLGLAWRGLCRPAACDCARREHIFQIHTCCRVFV